MYFLQIPWKISDIKLRQHYSLALAHLLANTAYINTIKIINKIYY